MSNNLKRLKELSERISQAVNESIDTAQSKRLGDNLAGQIRKRTRLGYGVGTNGQQQRLLRLTDLYIEHREDNRSDLSEATRPGKSNLTATGQMLNSLRGRGARAQIVVEITGNRTKELGDRRSRLSNSQVARYVQEQGRPFFKVTNAEKNGLAREVKRLILAKLRQK